MNKNTTNWLLSLFLLCIAASTTAQTMPQGESPKYEIRAVWLTTIGGIDWPRTHDAETQKAELCNMLDRLKDAGINTIFLQTRVRGTVIYPSLYEPWDDCITGKAGKAPNYDPLAFAIEACHKRGLQLHAWVVTLPIGKWNKLGCTQLRKKHANMVKRIGEDGYMSPESPKTADYLTNICKEIVDNYDVDGIHLDYIRYPETWKLKVSKSQGRANITRIVRTIHKGIKSSKPWVMFSCSPIGKHDDLTRYNSNGWNARTTVCQDAQQWLNEGIMDALFPMLYFRDNHFYPFAIDWQEHSYGRIIVPGLAIYFLDPHHGTWTSDVVTRQMNVSRDLGMGHCFFRVKFLLDNIKGIYDWTKDFNHLPALIPPMTWLSKKRPDQPVINEISKEGVLSWTDTPIDPQNRLVYNVYASERFPVDVTKAENLIATRLMRNDLMIDLKHPMNYAVTAQDRFGNESRPAQIHLRKTEELTKASSTAIPIVDQYLTIPSKPSTLNADYIVIETLSGQTVSACAYRKKINVSKLDEGFYQWRTLGKKGVTHRMGFFSIKRH